MVVAGVVVAAELGTGKRWAWGRVIIADAQGRIVTPKGNVVQPGITVPQNSTAITISPQGQVSAIVAGSTTPSVPSIQLPFLTPDRIVSPSSSTAIASPPDGTCRTV